MGTVMVTGGLGLTGRHITARLMAGGRSVVSYKGDVAPSEDGVATVQGEAGMDTRARARGLR